PPSSVGSSWAPRRASSPPPSGWDTWASSPATSSPCWRSAWPTACGSGDCSPGSSWCIRRSTSVPPPGCGGRSSPGRLPGRRLQERGPDMESVLTFPRKVESSCTAAVVNALTIDVEDYYQVSGFEPWIDRSSWDRFEPRVELGTEIILA